MLIESTRFSVSDWCPCPLPTTSQLAHSGKTARKPNGYRVSGVLNLGRLVLDWIQKKAASICGL